MLPHNHSIEVAFTTLLMGRTRTTSTAHFTTIRAQLFQIAGRNRIEQETMYVFSTGPVGGVWDDGWNADT